MFIVSIAFCSILFSCGTCGNNNDCITDSVAVDSTDTIMVDSIDTLTIDSVL